MNKIVHYIGLDVHKESIAVSIAPCQPVSSLRQVRKKNGEEKPATESLHPLDNY